MDETTNRFEQFQTPKSTQTFFEGVPATCKENVLHVLGNEKSSRKILEYYLYENWTDIIGANDTKRIKKLSIEEYLLCFEIISDVDAIPHGFHALMHAIFYDERDDHKQKFKHMRKPEFVQRTTIFMQKIMAKMDREVKNPYPNNVKTNLNHPEKHKIFKSTLAKLREEKTHINYADYKQTKECYEKYAALRSEGDKESRAKFDREN